MEFIPQKLLIKLYTRGSLTKAGNSITFKVKNRLANAKLTVLRSIKINNQPIDLEYVTALIDGESEINALELNNGRFIEFPLAKSITIRCTNIQVDFDKTVEVSLSLDTKPFGKLNLKFIDTLKSDAHNNNENTIPRKHGIEDFSYETIINRQKFIENKTGRDYKSLFKLKEDNTDYMGNIENHVGYASIPVGIAGPIQINGQYARGEFYFPLATTEGALVASYNKGVKLINAAGGVNCLVTEDQMQRAPVFTFRSMSEVPPFLKWLEHHFASVRETAEAGSKHAKLKAIEKYPVGNMVFLRFNFETGDAAGQNMVSKAVFQCCNWILEQYPDIQNFYLESNMGSDKKPSYINMLNTRGKRVTAEVTIPRPVMLEVMGIEPEQIVKHWTTASVGGHLAGVNNNGLQSPNGLAAMFIATGQDLGNIAEGCAGVTYCEINDSGDFYGTFTLTSLIVATYGGGTGLPTQRECLEMMDCYGNGKARKLAEIMAGVVAAGELSLASAISSLDWVTAHEKHGRNRV